MDDLVKTAVNEAKKVLKDKKNKNAIAASAIAYYISNENKERNAIVAGILGFTGVFVAAVGIAIILFYIFLILFVISLIMHLSRRGPKV